MARSLPPPRIATPADVARRGVLEASVRAVVGDIERTTGLSLAWRVVAYDEWIRPSSDLDFLALSFEPELFSGFGGGESVTSTSDAEDDDSPMWAVEVGGHSWSSSAGSAEEMLVAIAWQVQDDVIDDVGAWPVCPGHPHPADPALVDGRAVWVCERSGAVVAAIGELELE